MAHEIETMAFAGATPWHGLGEYIGEENLLSDEMIVRAGLDWSVKAVRLFAVTAPKAQGGTLVECPDNQAIIRTSDNSILGVVGSDYHVLQNREMFSALDDLVESGDMRYHTAGSLRNGKRVWALAKVGSVEPIKGDRTDHFLLIYSGHDGSTATRVLWTQVRVVCANTARAALSAGKGEGVSIRHTSNQKTRLAQAGKVLGLSRKAFERSEEFLKRAAKTPLTADRWALVLSELFPDPKEGSSSRAEAKRRDLTRLLFGGKGQRIDGVQGTAYAARNAVIEYCNYNRQTKSEGAQETRFTSSLWGSSASMIEATDSLILDWFGPGAQDLEPASTPVGVDEILDVIQQ